MDFKEYDKLTSVFRMGSANDEYVRLNLAGEVGEFLGLIAKAIRDGYPVGFEDLAKKEAGDILWQLNQACKDLGFTLEEAAQLNYEKLDSRNKRGAIQGSGDNR